MTHLVFLEEELQEALIGINSRRVYVSESVAQCRILLSRYVDLQWDEQLAN